MNSRIEQDLLDPGLLGRLSGQLLHARGLMAGSFSGHHRSSHRGSSVEFAQYRKYAPGDDIRSVDWRVYARSDRHYVKEFEADTNLRAYIVVDCSASMAYQPSEERLNKLLLSRKLAATLAHLLIHQGDMAGLLCIYGDRVEEIPPSDGPRHLRFLLKLLQETPCVGEIDLTEQLSQLASRIKRRAMVLVISDFICDSAPLLDVFSLFRLNSSRLECFLYHGR